ncbi:MAG: DUF4132 domain-containing protein [Verrucomicrobiota bacterium]
MSQKTPDGFAIQTDDPLAKEQALISGYLTDTTKSNSSWPKPKDFAAGKEILALEKSAQIRVLRAAIPRVEWLGTLCLQSHKLMAEMDGDLDELIRDNSRLDALKNAVSGLIEAVSSRKLPYTETDLQELLEAAATCLEKGQDFALTSPMPGLLPALIGELEARSESGVADKFRPALERLHRRYAGVRYSAMHQKFAQRLDTLLQRRGETNLDESCLPDAGEAWSDALRADVQAMPRKARAKWLALLANVPGATVAKPTAKWKPQAVTLLAAVGNEEFAQLVEHWFAQVGSRANDRIGVRNNLILRALVWYTGMLSGETACRALGNAAEGCLRKIPNGLYASSVGKACFYALADMPGLEPIAQLSRLKHRIKSPWGREEIGKALQLAAHRAGLAPAELEEITVPAFGLDANNSLRQTIGGSAVEIAVAGSCDVEVRWFDAQGKALPDVPAAVKKEHAEGLKSLKRLAGDIERMLGAQRDRIERMLNSEKTWNARDWKARYVEHPLIGPLARRLIWHFQKGKKTGNGIWHKGRFQDSAGRKIDWLDDEMVVRLWHPLGFPSGTVRAWRTWLEEQEVTQPFKQAHREIYLLTGAEMQTRTYSNRFAAHILKQHQCRALCEQRGWTYNFLGKWDSDNIGARLSLPQWNLNAQFWVNYANSQFADSGVALYVSSDQVRFCRGDGDEPVELTDVPALAFSEVMRDVDLFVSVSSIAADPNWRDQGHAQYEAYWRTHTFGELSVPAEVRRDVLARLLPKLKIAGRCELKDRYLVVRGQLRTYKIHLGSGNIQMEPNSQYLCIVPDYTKSAKLRDGLVFLPFEGDQLLSVILSKALLLADDDKIKDPTIVSQLKG